jgi:hypothetical protein
MELTDSASADKLLGEMEGGALRRKLSSCFAGWTNCGHPARIGANSTQVSNSR